MIKYFLKRVLIGLVTLWVIITITFALVHAIPGGPFDMSELEKLDENVKKNLEQSFGLDKPYDEQYTIYFKNLLKGELGVSIMYSPRTVKEIIKRELPVTARLGGISIIFSCLVGTLWGITAALKQGKWQDNTMRVLTAIGSTIPGFVLATLLIYVFAVKLRWVSPMGLKNIKSYILPALAMSFGSIAYLSRLTRSSLLDVVRQDYVRTAKAKGLTETTVTYKHALKNALLPVVTYVGPLVSSMLIGSFVIEKIFAIPGIGREMVLSIGNRDYMMVLGLTVFYSTILVMTFILVDLTYALIDPRIKFDE